MGDRERLNEIESVVIEARSELQGLGEIELDTDIVECVNEAYFSLGVVMIACGRARQGMDQPEGEPP